MGDRESAIEDHLVLRTRQLGGEVRKCQWIGRRGAPDRRVMLPDGDPFWAEIKSETGKLEAHQSREIERMRRNGETVVVFNSKLAIDAYLGFTFYGEDPTRLRRGHVVVRKKHER